MPYSLAIAQQPSPSTAWWYFEQLAGIPVCVGEGALAVVEVAVVDDVDVCVGAVVVGMLVVDPPTPMHTGRVSLALRPE